MAGSPSPKDNKIVITQSILSTVVGGMSSGLIALGIILLTDGNIVAVYIWLGTGCLIGFAWGSIVWTEKMFPKEKPQQRVFDQQVRLEVRSGEENYPIVDWIDMPIPKDKLVAFAKDSISYGFILSHSMAGGSQALSRAEFEKLRNIFISKGLAAWTNPNSHTQGCKLTAPGRSLFMKLAYPPDGKPEWLKKRASESTHTHT
jgi:hypothetical protein